MLMKITAVVPAAGAGARFSKSAGRKAFFPIKGRPLLLHTLLALESSGRIDNIIVVVRRDSVKRWERLISASKLRRVSAVIPGGRTRYDSVKKGLSMVGEASGVVIIHDGARPIIDDKIINDSIKACLRYGAAVCCVPLVSTVKEARGGLTVRRTPDRRTLYAAQTPQVFKKDIIIDAYARSRSARGVTDDSMLVERAGYKVRIVPGSYKNIKVTTPQDMLVAEALLR